MRIRGRIGRAAAVLALAAVGLCTTPALSGTAAASNGTTPDSTQGSTSNSTLKGNGSVEEAWVTGAHPGDRITLFHKGSPVPNSANPGTADSLGSLIVRDLKPGSGYYWVDGSTGHRTRSFPVLAPGQNPGSGSPL